MINKHYNSALKDALLVAYVKDTSQWLIDDLEHAVTLTSIPYAGSKEMDWDDTWFINDRHGFKSLMGAVSEVAWALSFSNAEIANMKPYYSKEYQDYKGLDFFINNHQETYQIKTVGLGTRGELELLKKYFKSKAKFLVLVDPINAKAYTLPASVWWTFNRPGIASVSRQRFWVPQSAVVPAGGTVVGLDNFVRRARLPIELRKEALKWHNNIDE